MIDRRVKTMAAAWLAAAACSDPAAPAVDAGPDASGDGGVPGLRGTIRITEHRLTTDDGSGTPVDTTYAWAGAAYYSARPPVFHQEVMREGACVLRRYQPSQCTPACTDGLCVATDVCEPWPTYESAGRLVATGLHAPLEMAGTEGHYAPDGALPADLFADDATVTATAEGAAFPPHAVTAGGVPPIVAAITGGVITLAPGQDHTLRWTPATDDARVRVTLNSNNTGHGLPYLGIIECDAPDHAGQVTIPAAMVDAFPPTQAWEICAGTDCPPSTIRRYRRGATIIGSTEVELVLASEYSFGVEHP